MFDLEVKSKNDLYKITVDEKEDLETRWEALRRFRSNEIHNPLLGDLDTFIIENNGLVHAVVKKCLNKTKLRVEYEELVQEGMIGFVKAYSAYDGRAAFSTFSYYHIRNEIMKFIRDKVSQFHVPCHIYELAGKVLRHRLENEGPELISSEFGCSLKSAIHALGHLNRKSVTTLNQVVSESYYQDVELLDLMSQEEDYTTCIVWNFLDSLNDKQRVVVELSLEGLTQAEIGNVRGVTQAQVWRDVQNVKKLAKEYFRKDELTG